MSLLPGNKSGDSFNFYLQKLSAGENQPLDDDVDLPYNCHIFVSLFSFCFSYFAMNFLLFFAAFCYGFF